MSEQNGLANLTRQVAVLEERMNAMNDSYDKGWKLIEAQLREDSAKRDAEMARRDAELARRWPGGMPNSGKTAPIGIPNWPDAKPPSPVG